MSVYPVGKLAITHYQVIEYFRVHTSLRIQLETGRTHQIRVHLAHINHPLVGDYLYGGYPLIPKEAPLEFVTKLRKFDKQALHAATLCLYHPISNVKMKWYAPIPKDMEELIRVMRIDFEKHNNSTN